MYSTHSGKSVLSLTILRLLKFRFVYEFSPNSKITCSVMKPLCFFGIIFGALVVLLFGLDLAIKLPFGRPSSILNTGFIIMGLILIYTGWMTQKEQR